jgi:hypothetical protein
MRKRLLRGFGLAGMISAALVFVSSTALAEATLLSSVAKRE